MKKILLIFTFVISYANSANLSSMQIESSQLKNESIVLIKKGSQLTQNNDGSFELKKGCFEKYSESAQKIKSCVNN